MEMKLDYSDVSFQNNGKLKLLIFPADKTLHRSLKVLIGPRFQRKHHRPEHPYPRCKG